MEKLNLGGNVLNLLGIFGVWMVHAIIFVTIGTLIWFAFVLPLVLERKVGKKYESFAAWLFIAAMVLALGCSIASVCGFLVIIPYPTLC